MIDRETVAEMNRAYREIEAAEKLLETVDEELKKEPDRVDMRGNMVTARRRCQLGFPSGDNSRRLYHVPPDIARAVIVAHIADQRANLEKLNEFARHQLRKGTPYDSERH